MCELESLRSAFVTLEDAENQDMFASELYRELVSTVDKFDTAIEQLYKLRDQLLYLAMVIDPDGERILESVDKITEEVVLCTAKLYGAKRQLVEFVSIH